MIKRLLPLALAAPLALGGCPQFQAGEAAVQTQAPALLASPTQIIAQQLILETMALQQLKAVLDGQQPPASPLGSPPVTPTPVPVKPKPVPPVPKPAPGPITPPGGPIVTPN